MANEAEEEANLAKSAQLFATAPGSDAWRQDNSCRRAAARQLDPSRRCNSVDQATLDSDDKWFQVIQAVPIWLQKKKDMTVTKKDRMTAKKKYRAALQDAEQFLNVKDFEDQGMWSWILWESHTPYSPYRYTLCMLGKALLELKPGPAAVNEPTSCDEANKVKDPTGQSIPKGASKIFPDGVAPGWFVDNRECPVETQVKAAVDEAPVEDAAAATTADVGGAAADAGAAMDGTIAATVVNATVDATPTSADPQAQEAAEPASPTAISPFGTPQEPGGGD